MTQQNTHVTCKVEGHRKQSFGGCKEVSIGGQQHKSLSNFHCRGKDNHKNGQMSTSEWYTQIAQ